MLQGQLNYEALRKLPIIFNCIEAAESFEANQMRCFTLNELNKSEKPLDAMNDIEKATLTAWFLDVFQQKMWL